MTLAEQQELARRINASYRWFIRDVLMTPLYPKTREIVAAVANPAIDQIAVMACHSSGKTYLLPRIALAFLFAHPNMSTVVTTAPGGRQVKDQFWRYLHDAHAKSKIPLGGELLQTEYKLGPRWFAKGFSIAKNAQGAVSMQGYHSENMLIILDEASGIEPPVWNAIETLRAGGNVKVIAIGNPTSTDSIFYRCFSKDRKYWHRIQISAFDTPNVQAKCPKGKELIKGLATYDWVREQREKYGPEDPLYQIRVLGQFPTMGNANLIQVLWTDWAIQDPPPFDANDMIYAGLDVSHEGLDETVLAIRVGNRLIRPVTAVRGWDTEQVARLVIDELGGVRDSGKLAKIAIDAIGIGAGVADRLDHLGWPVERIIGSGRVTTFDDRYLNLRAQMWFNLRDLFKNRLIGGPIDETTQNQLTAIRYQVTPEDKIKVEAKQDFRKRMGYSPDRADAIMYCFADTTGANIVEQDMPNFGGDPNREIVYSREGLTLLGRAKEPVFGGDAYSEYQDDADVLVDEWMRERDILTVDDPLQHYSGIRKRYW